MPFESQAQRRFLFAKHPKIAREFASKTPKDVKLPEKKKKKTKLENAASKRSGY